MIEPKTLEELASYVEKPDKQVFFFKADWCPDCQFIYPVMPEIEAENPEFTFISVDCDTYMIIAQKWDVFGIPSFVVLENGREIGRLVNKRRKTKDEINQFLAGLNKDEGKNNDFCI
ncbi:thioredoxin family protein [Streptococcus dentapri]|uniref:Thioredoxin family protein n=1 Tax=Streptococcus dentapri TaxID=573564 RepID=A0ABV8D0B1_9STRE